MSRHIYIEININDRSKYLFFQRRIVRSMSNQLQQGLRGAISYMADAALYYVIFNAILVK
jgi:hypothetical protein